jgi:hypothetical protein
MKRPLLAAVGLVGMASLFPGAPRTATLVSRPGFRITGTVEAIAVSSDTLKVNVDVQGAPARSEIPWAVHEGTCANVGPVHGDRSEYPPLVTDFTGESWEKTVLSVPLITGRPYVVVVSRPGAPSQMAACGELKE